jgi:hypothetical protein
MRALCLTRPGRGIKQQTDGLGPRRWARANASLTTPHPLPGCHHPRLQHRRRQARQPRPHTPPEPARSADLKPKPSGRRFLLAEKRFTKAFGRQRSQPAGGVKPDGSLLLFSKPCADLARGARLLSAAPAGKKLPAASGQSRRSGPSFRQRCPPGSRSMSRRLQRR